MGDHDAGYDAIYALIVSLSKLADMLLHKY